MCIIIGPSRKRVGYKFLYMKSGKFYSSFTGQQIKVGKVPKAPLKAKRLTNYWNDLLDTKVMSNLPFYNPKFAGMTSAFINKRDAYDFFNIIASSNFIRFDSAMIPVLVKITFRAPVFEGVYSWSKVIASNYIDKIERIK